MNVIDCTRKKQDLSTYVNDVKECLDNDGVIVYPTDTLYALGCNPFRNMAVQKIFDIKKRPLNMPLSVAVCNLGEMRNIAFLNDLATRVIKRFLPGPLTILLRKKDTVPEILTAGSENVAVRIPNHPVALDLLNALGPLVATSANLHGIEEPIEIETPLRHFKGSVNFYINCGKTRYGKPSTIIDLSTGEIKVVRDGAFPISVILEEFK